MANLTVQYCFNSCVLYLKNQDFEDAEVTVLFIFEYVLKNKYVQLLANDYILTSDQYRLIFDILNRCLTNEPLAYILGEAHFNSTAYKVAPGVLIPRPETEELVALAKHVVSDICLDFKDVFIYECGIGSGVISIELAKMFPAIPFVAWDISSVAVEVSTFNMETNSVNNLSVYEGDFFDKFDPYYHYGKCQLIVSNPPYISEDVYLSLDDRVKREPKEALVAKNNGLAIVIDLIELAIKHDIILILEIGYDQREKLSLCFTNIELIFRQDLSGKDRFLIYFPNAYKKNQDTLLSTLSN